MRTAMTLLFLAGAAAAQETDRSATARKISSLRVTVNFEGTALADAIDYLREVTALNFVIAGTDVDATQKLTLKVKDLPVKSVLKLMLHPRELTASWRQGAIVIEQRMAGNEKLTLQLYDIRSLLKKLQDFPGPTVELVSPRTHSMGPVTGAIFRFDDPDGPLSEDTIVDIIRENTGSRSWDENPNAVIQMANGRLLVTQSRKVHAEISRLLQLLEQY